MVWAYGSALKWVNGQWIKRSSVAAQETNNCGDWGQDDKTSPPEPLGDHTPLGQGLFARSGCKVHRDYARKAQ